jgi:hypothetical protein
MVALKNLWKVMWLHPISQILEMEDEPLTGGLDEDSGESPHDGPLPRSVS